MKQDARAVHYQLQKVMRTFGRRCRGQSRLLVSWVRQTERQLLEVGHLVGPLALKASLYLYEDTRLEERQRQRLQAHLSQATQAYERIEQQSRRLIHGKPLAHAKIVNPYDRTIAPILKGKSNCPVQFGKKPGFIAEMATGFFFGLHLPEGNPDDASYVPPLFDQVDRAIAAMSSPRKPGIRSLAGDLAFRAAALREPLHQRGILTVGIPHSTEPLPRSPTPQMIQATQQDWPTLSIPADHHVRVAYACGYSRPFVESLVEQLACRGGTQLKYKGHRGALVQLTMAMMDGAILVRIRQGRLSKRAHRFRRWFCLKPPNSLQDNNRKISGDYVDPARSLVARGLGARLWEQTIAPTLGEYVSRPSFERACRQYLWRALEAGHLPPDLVFTAVGTWWGGGDRELDVVATDERGSAVLAGSCKWTRERMDVRDYAALQRDLELAGLVGKGIAPWLALFSRAGFTARLRELAADQRPKRLLLIDLKQMYGVWGDSS